MIALLLRNAVFSVVVFLLPHESLANEILALQQGQNAQLVARRQQQDLQANQEYCQEGQEGQQDLSREGESQEEWCGLDWFAKYLSAPKRYLGLPDLSNPEELVREGTLTFYLDNDLFGGTDENYTNGARFSWVSADIDRTKVPWVHDVLARFSKPIVARHEGPVFYAVGVSLTQLMYTPEDIFASVPDRSERPYAGWLGLGFSVHTKSARALDSVELAFGLTGQYSFAETAQDFIHSLYGIEKANGWDHQLSTELTANIHYTHREMLLEAIWNDAPLRLELLGKYGFDLGNFLTQARTGVDFRFGYNLPQEWHYSALNMNAHTHRLFGFDQEEKGNWSWFIGGGSEIKAVAWNMSLDGNLFANSPSVEKRPIVFEVYGNCGVRVKNWTISYQQTFRTKEYRAQEESQLFGSLAISLLF